MRVVHVCAQYPPELGGSAVHVRGFSEGLARRGHEVSVLTLAHRYAPPQAQTGRVTVRRCRPNRGATALVRALLRMPGGYRAMHGLLGAPRMDQLVRGPLALGAVVAAARAPADVLGVMNWADALLAGQMCWLGRRRGIPVVGFPHFHTEEAWSRNAVYGRMLAACAAVVVSTPHERTFVEARSPGTRVHVLGVGVDPETLAVRDGRRIRARYGMGSDPVVGYVGRITTRKGVLALIEAMRLVWEAHHEAWLLLAGQFPEGTPSDGRILEALGCLSKAQRDRVVFFGDFPEAEKASIFDSLDVLAMPSPAESFGIAYLEAWTCGKPVVGARIGATACVIREGVDGLMARPDDPPDIARAIADLLADPARRRRMGRAGHERTISEFTWDRLVERLEGIYRDCLPVRVDPSVRDGAAVAAGGTRPGGGRASGWI